MIAVRPTVRNPITLGGEDDMKQTRTAHLTGPQSRLSRMIAAGGLVVALQVLPPIAEGVHAQYIYLDSNGDGVATSTDALHTGATNVVGIWLSTNENRDGSAAAVPSVDRNRLTINSYSLCLRVLNGQVKFGDYENLQPTMTIPVGIVRSPTELYVAYAGGQALAPGRYLLGRATVSVISGRPSIVVASHSTLDPTFFTSFGSRYCGADGDNTLKLADVGAGGLRAPLTSEWKGDWADADGLVADTIAEASLSAENSPTSASPPAVYGVRVAGSGSSGRVSLVVTTTITSDLHVRLFDVRGRLVRDVADFAAAGPGIRNVDLTGGTSTGEHLAAGIYFYRVISEEGTVAGKVVVLK